MLFPLYNACYSALAAEPDRAEPVRLQQDHGRRGRADRGEPAEAALSGPVLVPADHRRCLGIHCLRLESIRGAYSGQVQCFAYCDPKAR